MVSINLKCTLFAPPEKVAAILLEHAYLERFFNAQFSQLKPHNKGEMKGGAGSIRQVKTPLVAFNEQIIHASSNHICYRIMGDKPVENHQGDIYLTPFEYEGNTATALRYCIAFRPPWWMPDSLIKLLVKHDISQALKKLQHYFKRAQHDH